MEVIEWIKHVRREFSRIYLGGIPSLLNDEAAFLSFIIVLTGTEALAGFRRPDIKSNRERFSLFVQDYYPAPYKTLADQLWDFRNTMVHAFLPGPFKITHHHSEVHFKKDNGILILNAEDFYAALMEAARRYFDALSASPDIQKAFLQRVGGEGIIVVAPLNDPKE